MFFWSFESDVSFDGIMTWVLGQVNLGSGHLETEWAFHFKHGDQDGFTLPVKPFMSGPYSCRSWELTPSDPCYPFHGNSRMALQARFPTSDLVALLALVPPTETLSKSHSCT